MKIMSESGLLSISDFAQFTRTTRDTLLHYDRIGLLSPVQRGENNYRYYSGSQLAIVNVIRTFRQLGMTLEEIRELKDKRTPELTNLVFEQQIGEIDKKIEEWVRARKLLLTLKKAINSSSDVDENKIEIKFLPAEAIILGDLNDYSRNRTDFDTLLTFYHDMSRKYPNLDLNYPVWAMYSQDQLKKRDWSHPDRYYFYNPEGYEKRPAALYVIGYMRGGYSPNDELYAKLSDYIDENGYEICGNAYEEYPENEICAINDKDYLIRVMIMVKEK
ncbi:MAG: MerR family transcriptional regulator [Oscillospiraceae bacterium]|jgi:DNA-binding transcriptional MerR regulator/effector-binding domain-containing protein|nr:MerR family transcriptional regulator [Oscillospiraceae bacterium]